MLGDGKSFGIHEVWLSLALCGLVPGCVVDFGEDSGQSNTNEEVCGNGVIDPGEECDGSNLASLDCVEMGYEGGNLTCGSDCILDTTDCVGGSLCGNGALDDGEECDGDRFGGARCLDFGFDGGELTCSEICLIDTSGCEDVLSCGDGDVGPDEQCDDGNDSSGDGCSATCEIEPGWSCDDGGSVCQEICGDDLMVGNEGCDDGNSAAGDGCSQTCQVEDGWQCDEDNVCVEICGDGMLVGGEGCDDGNSSSEDGCSDVCTVEQGWSCTGEPSFCGWGGYDWVLIEAGSPFEMGSPPTEAGRGSDELQHEVTLTHDYAILSSEVTQGMFQTLMGYNPSDWDTCGPSCPVEMVSWHEAAAWCNALSQDAGLSECYSCSGTGVDTYCQSSAVFVTPYDCPGFRLPTEAEWEYAARAGTETATYAGDLDPTILACEQPNPVLDPIAWFCEAETQAVMQKAPNGWGLYDMLGNVWEWCHDPYEEVYPAGPVTDPVGAPGSGYRSFRGGAWHYVAASSRAAARDRRTPVTREYFVGFRPVKTQP